MKRNLYHFIILFLVFASFIYASGEERPKIGLVLSGGGARGLAHIGILEMIDSLQIPIDYIAGTSMGGVVGALYAIGYGGLEIEKITRSSDWQELFTDTPARAELPYLQKKDDGKYQFEFGIKGFTPVIPSGLISGQKISLLFSNLTVSAEYISDFDQFSIPFRCVAADLITGNEVILKSGSISKAMRATMSIPSVFSPVEWGDSLLVDGGIINNLPVDAARDMGAEIIIAVNVGTPMKKRENLNSMVQILEQSFYLPGYQREEENINISDIIITPGLKGYSSSDFDDSDIKRIIQIGKEAAARHKLELIELKEKYHLTTGQDTTVDEFQLTNQIIHGISITGNTSLPFKFLYKLFDIKPGDIFDAVKFKNKLAEIRTSGLFNSVDYQIRRKSAYLIRLIIIVKEKKKPLIHGITITGNESLPFKFIYRLLRIKPLEIFEPEKVNRRINELYSLGYFETINYEIEPVAEGRIRLNIKVKERPERKLRVGFHYDNFYKLVGAASLQATNLLVPGVRFELILQFAGLKRFQWRVSYPSRTLNFPVSPYLQLNYKDIPVNIYEEEGSKITSYHDRSTAAAAGINLLLGKFASVEVEYNIEYMNIKPDIAFPDPIQFPSWKDQLKKLQIRLSFDILDDVILPRKGFVLKANYEASMKDLYSDINYDKFDLLYDQYFTFYKRHTIRFNGSYYWGSEGLPEYKWHYTGGAESFIGFDYCQLAGIKFNILRFEYRYEHKKDIFLKAIFNIANNQYKFPMGIEIADTFWGYGIGVKFLSIIGPFEFIYARGHRSYFEPLKMRNMFYFQAGCKL
jgi:predicted acylesterase/phospholipase RssA/outer membrane translocation and assembly module TamA